MDRIVTRGPDGAIADPTCAIAERLLAEALQCLGDEFQMVLNGAGGDTGTHADRLAFYRYGSAGRLGHVYLANSANAAIIANRDVRSRCSTGLSALWSGFPSRASKS